MNSPESSIKKSNSGKNLIILETIMKLNQNTITLARKNCIAFSLTNQIKSEQQRLKCFYNKVST